MKKLITLFLVLTGIVCSASATDWIVAGSSAIVNGDSEWANTNRDNQAIAVTGNDHQYYLIVENCALMAETTYSFKFVEYDNWDYTFPDGNYNFTVNKSGTYTIIYSLTDNGATDQVKVCPVLNMTLSNNYNGANIWDTYNADAVFSHESGTPKWSLDLDAEPGADDWYFRIFLDGQLTWNANDGKFKLCADTSDKSMTIGGSSDGSWLGTDTKSWKVSYPSYPFDHFTITAEYDVENQYANHWNISVDAYISKTLDSDYNYATLGSGAKLDLSVLDAEGVTAYPLTADYSSKTITKGSAFSGVLPADEGVLLEYDIDEDKTIEIPVSADDAASISNDLVACTTGHVDQADGDGYTKYILSVKDGHVGFYMVNEAKGNNMLDYTAYLNVVNAADTAAAGENAAREFFLFDDDETATGISKVAENKQAGEYYNLSGQRVAQPVKGLYIVNGKKVIIK